MEECGFGVFEFDGDVAGEAEVGVLVDGAGDEAGYVGCFAEDLGERVGEGRCGLNGGEVDFPDVVAGGCRLTFQICGQEAMSTHESLKPNVALAWLIVIWRESLETLR